MNGWSEEYLTEREEVSSVIHCRGVDGGKANGRSILCGQGRKVQCLPKAGMKAQIPRNIRLYLYRNKFEISS